MAEQGNPASASDAGVGALCARAAVRGAWLNVRTNLAGPNKPEGHEAMLAEGTRIEREAGERESKVLAMVERKFK